MFPSLEQITEYNYLSVAPETLLLDAALEMYKEESNFCKLDTIYPSKKTGKYYDYLLVTKDKKLDGLILEGDIIKVIAKGKNIANLTVREVMAQNIPILKKHEYEGIFQITSLFRQYKIRHLPVIDEQDNLWGIITPKTLQKSLEFLNILPSITVAEIMRSQVVIASPYASLVHLANLMVKKQISSVVIASNPQELLGIVTEKDLVTTQILGLNCQQHKAIEIMAFPLFSISASQNIYDAQEMMNLQSVRRLIVKREDEQIAGIITEGDIIRAIHAQSLYQSIARLQENIKKVEQERDELVKIKNQELDKVYQEQSTSLQKHYQCDILLSEISRKIQQSLGFTEVINAAVEKSRLFFEVDRVIVYRFSSQMSGVVVAESVAQGWESFLDKKITDNNFNKKLIKNYENGLIGAVNNTDSENLYHYGLEILSQMQVKAYLLVPLLQDSKVWGVLMAQNCSQPREWQDLEIFFLKSVATKIEIALKQFQLFESVQKELLKRQKIEKTLSLLAKEQAVIAQLSQQALADTNLDNLMQKAVSLLTKTLQVPYALILEIMPNQAAFLLKTGIGWQDDLIGRARITIERKNQAGYTLALGQPVVVKDLRVETRFSGSALFHNHGIISGITVVIDGKKTPFGILGIHTNKQRAFSENDVNFVQSVANVIATAIERKKVEEDLNYFFELSLDIFVIAGIDYDFKRINNRLQEVLGYSQEELLEYSMLKFVHPDDVEKTTAEIEKTILGIPMINFENRYLCKNGSYRWLSWSGLSINDLLYCAARDVTERKQMELSLQELNEQLAHLVNQRTNELEATTLRLVNLITCLESGILILDEFQKVLLINQSFCKIFNLVKTPQNLVGTDFSNFFESHRHYFINSEDFIKKNREVIQDKKPVYNEEIFFSDGRIFEKDYVPIFLGNKFLGNVWMYRDITTQKKAAEKVLKALEKEKELNELKSRFITTTSHEFRTPLAIISSSANLLQSYGEKLDQTKKQKYLQRISTSVNHMVQLLEDVLTINKAEADKLQFKPEMLNLLEFCTELVEQMQLTTEKHQIIFEHHGIGEEGYNIDTKLLQKILTNLLSNAIKYSPEGGKVEFSLTKIDDQLSFKIKDHGIGISTEDQSKLFETFHRGKNVNTIPGTGLGLSIAKKCVELHHGKIILDSTIGEGTTFMVTVPATIET